MYDPCTLAFSFPPYPAGGVSLSGHRLPWSFGRMLYTLKPWIGFDIWHVDPENRSPGQRTDDSCGWFDRRAGAYADAAAYVLKDEDAMWEIRRSFASAERVEGPYGHAYPRMSKAETLALTLMTARYLELRRWWNGQYGGAGAHGSWRLRWLTRQRNVLSIAFDLALVPYDNLQAPGEDAEAFVRLIAAALNRRFRPWWKHPRWHVHHWRVHFDIWRNLRRMFQRCAGCGKSIGFGASPVRGANGLFHFGCAHDAKPVAWPGAAE